MPAIREANQEQILSRIRVKNLPQKGEMKRPEAFIVEDVEEISLECFLSEWAERHKYSPILIGFGIQLKDYEALDDEDDDFLFFGFKMDFEDGRLYIVDTHTCGQQSSLHSLTSGWWTGFIESFQNGDELCCYTGRVGFNGMQADASWSFRKTFQTQEIRIPFLVVESAWSQSSASLRHKISRWLDLGVLFAIGLEKNFVTGETFVFLREKDSDLMQKWIFHVNEEAAFKIFFSKRLIFKYYHQIEEFDVNGEAEFIEIPVDAYFHFH